MILGTGAYGKVIRRNGSAVKQYSEGKLPCLVQEYAALKYLSDCKYIVHAKDVDFANLELSMDLYDLSLRDWLLQQDLQKLSLGTVLPILRDILLGLVELHDRNLAHGDIKPGNILMNKNPLKVVLGDCGFVSIAKYAKNNRTAKVYRDPIVSYDSSHDMFSFGICMLELIGKVRLYRQRGYEELRKIVVDYVSDAKYKKILLSLLSSDHQERPSSRFLLKEMFSLNPEPWQKPLIQISSLNNNNRVTMENITSQDLQSLREVMLQQVDKYEIKRSKRGFIALTYWLNRYKIDQKDHKFYMGIVLLIIATLFNGNKYGERVLLAMCEDTRQINSIPNIIKNMLNDVTFRNILLAPE